MAGITSSASKAAQGKPTHLVTSNSSGDLAAFSVSQLGLATTGDISNLQSKINRLGDRDRELTEGLAAVVSLAQPVYCRVSILPCGRAGAALTALMLSASQLPALWPTIFCGRVSARSSLTVVWVSGPMKAKS